MTPLTPHSIGLTGVFLGWMGLLFAMLMGRRSKREVRATSREIGGPLSIVFQGVSFAIVFNGRLDRPAPFFTGSVRSQWIAAAMAVSLALSSAMFLFAAVRTLGKQWSLQPQLVVNHTLIQQGPYSIVRHPIYTSMFGLMLATGLVLTSATAMVIATIFLLIGTTIRIRVEERLLRTSFGEEYKAYGRRVPAFIPFLF